ncbi:MAG: HAD-IA family hydrolase [Coriobacteriia bacterium]|nr:HAD-IA family hydrolase [Coriobacteriia bacterium]
MSAHPASANPASPHSTPTGFDAVFFDVGNTLLAPFPSIPHVVQEVLAEAGYATDLSAISALMPLVDEYYEKRYQEDETFWTDDDRTVDVWVGMYSLLCKHLGIDSGSGTGHFAHRVYHEFGSGHRWRAYDDVVPALVRLRKRGMRVGLISNWDSRLSGIVADLGLADLIDLVVSSADAGLYKPDPQIFIHALQGLGVEACRAAHVGDHVYADVVGARSVGMLPVLIDRRRKEKAAEGVRHIHTLDELDDALGLG